MKDPYSILGVKRTASDEEIKKAFRALAKKHHPDAGAKDQAAVKRFQEMTAAYDLLSDPKKRAQYDRGEIDENGQPRVYAGGAGAWGGRPFAQRGFRQRAQAGAEHPNFEDIFADFFGGAFSGGHRPPGGARGADVAYTLNVSFEEGARGATKRVTLPNGKRLDVKIPAGVEDGQQIRLKGQGEPGRGSAETGDALVTIHVEPHAYFTRDGRDIHLELPITIGEAIGGAKISAPTLTGDVTLTIPPNASSGMKLRLKGKGVPAAAGEAAGDQYLILKIALPETPDQELASFIARWSAAHPYNPRAKLTR